MSSFNLGIQKFKILKWQIKKKKCYKWKLNEKKKKIQEKESVA